MEEKIYKRDKKEIALALREAVYNEDLSCSLQKNYIISSCDKCNLKSMCKIIESVVEEEKEKNIKIVKSFDFN